MPAYTPGARTAGRLAHQFGVAPPVRQVYGSTDVYSLSILEGAFMDDYKHQQIPTLLRAVALGTIGVSLTV